MQRLGDRSAIAAVTHRPARLAGRQGPRQPPRAAWVSGRARAARAELAGAVALVGCRCRGRRTVQRRAEAEVQGDFVSCLSMATNWEQAVEEALSL